MSYLLGFHRLVGVVSVHLDHMVLVIKLHHRRIVVSIGYELCRYPAAVKPGRHAWKWYARYRVSIHSLRIEDDILTSVVI